MDRCRDVACYVFCRRRLSSRSHEVIVARARRSSYVSTIELFSRGVCGCDGNRGGQRVYLCGRAGNHDGRGESHGADPGDPRVSRAGHGKCHGDPGGDQSGRVENRADPAASRGGQCERPPRLQTPIQVLQSTVKPEFVVAYRLSRFPGLLASAISNPRRSSKLHFDFTTFYSRLTTLYVISATFLILQRISADIANNK